MVWGKVFPSPPSGRGGRTAIDAGARNGSTDSRLVCRYRGTAFRSLCSCRAASADGATHETNE